MTRTKPDKKRTEKLVVHYLITKRTRDISVNLFKIVFQVLKQGAVEISYFSVMDKLFIEQKNIQVRIQIKLDIYV